jgi:hypothetical protein
MIGITFLFLLGCAGPATPFGAVPIKEIYRISKGLPDELSDPDMRSDPLMPARGIAATNNAYIAVSPKNQVFHKKQDLRVHLHDSLKLNMKNKITVKFNGINMTDEFYKKAQVILNNNNNLVFEFENFKLNPKQENKINFSFKSAENKKLKIDITPPTCFWNELNEIKSTEWFSVHSDMLKWINYLGEKERVNPILLGGLIAQESGFNTKALSYSKALGLTQITPIAEKEIISEYPEFPRFPKINNLSFLKLKSLISFGKINATNEWRLDPKKSIQGGLAYLNYLKTYWNKNEQKEFLDRNLGDDINFEKEVEWIILASYNSGFTRVRNSIFKNKSSWLNDVELSEARRYVNMISSYCFAFSGKLYE